MNNLDKHMKTFILGGDPRSSRGILSRGKNVYGANGRNAPKTANLRKAALKRMKQKR